MSVEAPISRVSAAAYRIPTDGPEADGTISWDATTMVVVRVEAGGEGGLGWTYGAAAAAGIVTELLAGHVMDRCALDVPGCNAAMRAIYSGPDRGALPPPVTELPPS